VILLGNNSYNFISSTLYSSYVYDLYNLFSSTALPTVTLFSSSYQDIYSIVLLIAPELIASHTDYFSIYHDYGYFNTLVVACFDSYSNNLNYILGEGVLSLCMFIFFS